jgi:hypothetical protein
MTSPECTLKTSPVPDRRQAFIETEAVVRLMTVTEMKEGEMVGSYDSFLRTTIQWRCLSDGVVLGVWRHHVHALAPRDCLRIKDIGELMVCALEPSACSAELMVFPSGHVLSTAILAKRGKEMALQRHSPASVYNFNHAFRVATWNGVHSGKLYYNEVHEQTLINAAGQPTKGDVWNIRNCQNDVVFSAVMLSDAHRTKLRRTYHTLDAWQSQLTTELELPPFVPVLLKTSNTVVAPGIFTPRLLNPQKGYEKVGTRIRHDVAFAFRSTGELRIEAFRNKAGSSTIVDESWSVWPFESTRDHLEVPTFPSVRLRIRIPRSEVDRILADSVPCGEVQTVVNGVATTCLLMDSEAAAKCMRNRRIQPPQERFRCSLSSDRLTVYTDAFTDEDPKYECASWEFPVSLLRTLRERVLPKITPVDRYSIMEEVY